MADGELLEDVLGEWLDARDRGDAPDPAALLRAHPELADELPRQLRALDVLEQVLGTTGPHGYGMPSRLGPYRIEEQIGAGGMGTVFRATVEQPASGLTAGQTVAAKVVHPHVLQTKRFFPRFHREAALGRAVDHPNVVKTYSFDVEVVDDIPLCYLIMEYVEGQTLRALLEELGSVGEPFARAVGEQVALGLSAIHAAGAVHRDIKPENVLITRESVVKVMDLGVARVDAETAGFSHTGAFVGSLAYASPEQFDGSIVDPRCDLHALGLLLYELCAGENPYGADSPAQAIERIRSLLPRRLADAAPHVSDLLDDVVHTLLAKSPGDRFTSAVEVAALLDAGENSEWWRQRTTRRCGARARPSRRARVPRETAVHGRDDVLATLRASYDAASRGEGSVVLVEGEAGIGKSRVVDELCRALDDDGAEHHLLVAELLPGATGDEALRGALREHLGSAGSASLLTELPLLVPAFDALLEGREPPEEAVALTRDSLATCFVHALRGMAAQWPTILVVEDLHNASEDARTLFTSLAYAVPGHRVLLVGTSRPGVPEKWRANLLRLEHVQSLPLSRLGPRDLAQLLEESFRSEMLAERLAYLIGTKSDGNPFFVLEIARGLREAGLIVRRDDGSWESTQEIDEIEVPDTVRELIEARLTSLTDHERHVLDVAACCGFEFDPSLVAEAMDSERIPLIRALAQIERRHRLVRASGWRFTFDHHQVLEVLHLSLPEPLREAYHLAIAEALEARHNAAENDPESLDGALCVQLCEHFLEGGQGEWALRYMVAAQTHLEKGYLHAQSIALTERALAAPEILTGIERANALLRLAETEGPLDLLGRRARQEECARELEALAHEAGDEELCGKAAGTLGLVFLRTGRREQAESSFRRALESARTCSSGPGRSHAVSGLGAVLFAQGRLEEAAEQFQHTLSLCREIGDRRGAASSLVNLGTVYVERGLHADARASLERALALSREIGHRRVEAIAVGRLGAVLLSEHRFPEAQEHRERYLAICREIGNRYGEACALMDMGRELWRQRSLTAATESYERSLAVSRDTGSRHAEACACAGLGVVLRSQDRFAEAEARFERQLAIGRELGDQELESGATTYLGSVLLHEGRLVDAKGHFERLLSRSRELGARRSEAVALSNLAAVAHESGDVVEAEDGLVTTLAMYEEFGTRYHVAGARLRLGRLRAAAGDTDAAREHLEAAKDTSHEFHLPGYEVLASCELAVLPGGDPQDAVAALAAHESQLDAMERREARLLLWKATGDRTHLEEAKRLLDDLLAKNPPEVHESMCRNVRVNREILAAWREEFGEDGSETIVKP